MSQIVANWKVLLTILIILLLGVFYTHSVVQKNVVIEQESKPAFKALETGEDEVAYTDMSGNELDLSQYIGQVLVVNSWASWSPDSAQELSALSELADEFAGQGIKVLAINRAEPATTAERFLRSTGATGNVQLVLDPDDNYYKSINGYAMPETIFYDVSGNISHHQHGVMTKEQMKSFLELALQADEQ